MPQAVPRIAPPARRRQRPPVTPGRALGPNDFAFYRGYLQGLDLGRLADRYLDNGLDLRLVRSQLLWIEEALARGVRRLATRPRSGGSGQERMLTESAWLALIHAPAGESVTARQTRQRRLLRALDALQPMLLTRPTAADAVSGWLAPAIAAKLADAGWQTLGALQAAVGAGGQGWYRRVPGIGARTARQVESWLQEQGVHIGAMAAVLAPGPLESLRAPGARADVRAIQGWLGGYQPEGGHTWRAYRTQAERFLLWTLHARGKSLATVTAEDGAAYIAFLADPQPSAQWVGRRGTPRDRHDWRPFEGPLSPASIRHARKILSTLYGCLIEQGHARANPFEVLSLPTGGDAPRIQVARSFTEPQWRFLLRHVSSLPADDPRAARLTFMLHLAHASGLRISEQAVATVGHLTWSGHWTLAVPGPKPRQIPLPEAVIDALRGHLAARGLGRGFESLPAATPLIGRVKTGDEGDALSVAQIGAIWKRYFAQAATLAGGEDDAAQLAQASAHWMRHTAGAHAVARGVALEVVQQQLGHASLDTTSMYVLAA